MSLWRHPPGLFMLITIRVDQKLLRRAVGIRIWTIKQARLLGCVSQVA